MHGLTHCLELVVPSTDFKQRQAGGLSDDVVDRALAAARDLKQL